MEGFKDTLTSPTTRGATTKVEDRNTVKEFGAAPIVWAVDAFPDEDETNFRTASCLQRLFPLSPIHPVYILSEESFTDRGFSSFLRPGLKPMALKSMQAFLQQVRFLDIRKPRVLIEMSASRPACARKLLRYAGRIGAGMISLGSHGRRGLSRFLVGSFSEAVLDSSRLPVLITGPRLTTPRRPAKAVVFPTDFSEACHDAFDEVIALARQLGAELHLFHKTMHIMDPIIQSGVHMLGGGWVSVEAYMNQPPEDRTKDANAWMARAAAEGVNARFINENFREPTSEAIVQYVKNLDEASVVLAMVSRASHMEATLLGSVTRDVIRSSPCPVYIAARST